MAATIKDIAKAVGVNPSTVSRVINGTATISEETKEKINKAMRDLDYHPNSYARSLANGSTFTIGLVIDAGNKDAFSNAFFIQSVTAIEAVAQDKEYNVLITNDSHSEHDNTITNMVLERKVDGLIIPVQCMNDELVNLMISNDFPFVIMGEPQKNKTKICWVDVDNEQGGELAVRHLIENGYKNPMLLVEDKKTIFEGKRMKGFEKECGKCGITDPKVHTYTDQRIDEILDDIVSGKRDIDSFICTNNIVAFKVLKAAKAKKIKIPKEIGLLTFDNYPLAEYMEPALSVVDIDTYKMGTAAAELLFLFMKGRDKKVASKLVETQIIERESTRYKK